MRIGNGANLDIPDFSAMSDQRVKRQNLRYRFLLMEEHGLFSVLSFNCF